MPVRISLRAGNKECGLEGCSATRSELRPITYQKDAASHDIAKLLPPKRTELGVNTSIDKYIQS